VRLCAVWLRDDGVPALRSAEAVVGAASGIPIVPGVLRRAHESASEFSSTRLLRNDLQPYRLRNYIFQEPDPSLTNLGNLIELSFGCFIKPFHRVDAGLMQLLDHSVT
jgi:hypothetical protein